MAVATALALNPAMIACAAILIAGLPHGALDLALLRHGRARGAVAPMLAIYLLAGCTMAALWAVAPTLALAAFFALAIGHFAEDWDSALPQPLAIGLATAMLCAPALLHRSDIAAIFVLLTGEGAAASLAIAATVVAPVALATAAAGVAMLWAAGQARDAIATATCLFAMIALPPVIAFALYFCLFHSPRQLAATRATLGYRSVAQGFAETLGMSVLALGLAALVALVAPGTTLSDTMVRAAFITLSIVTLPHLAAPMLVAALLDRRAGPQARATAVTSRSRPARCPASAI